MYNSSISRSRENGRAYFAFSCAGRGSSLSLRASVRGKELFKPNCISSLRVADQNGFCDENENFKKLQSFSTSSLRKRFWDGPALRHGSTRSLRATHAYEHR